MLDKLPGCRTPARGGELFACPRCGSFPYAYPSCNDRHCPLCGQTDADTWLADHTALLLPTPCFRLAFTVPDALRTWLRAHPEPGLDVLFATSARALQALAAEPRRPGASLGMLGVLHTGSRTLIYHPHVHYLVPAGGLSPDQRQWVPRRPRFLVHVHPLADHFRTLIPARTRTSGSRSPGVVARAGVEAALGRPLPGGRLRGPYRDSATGRAVHLDLEPSELLRRFLQHVLPAGFHRVRRFGWLHPAARVKRNRVRALLDLVPQLTEAERAAWQPPTQDWEAPEPDPPPAPTPVCPRRLRPMVRVWQALGTVVRRVPGQSFRAQRLAGEGRNGRSRAGRAATQACAGEARDTCRKGPTPHGSARSPAASFNPGRQRTGEAAAPPTSSTPPPPPPFSTFLWGVSELPVGKTVVDSPPGLSGGATGRLAVPSGTGWFGTARAAGVAPPGEWVTAGGSEVSGVGCETAGARRHQFFEHLAGAGDGVGQGSLQGRRQRRAQREGVGDFDGQNFHLLRHG